MEQSLKQDSMNQNSTNDNVPNKGANAISAKAQIDDDQANFMKEAAMGSLMEIEAGKLAANNAADPRVKDFAARMVADHTKASMELKPIAQELGILLPSVAAGAHSDHLKILGSKTGAAFDRAYMDLMVKDHAKTVQLFKLYTAARHPAIAEFAGKYLPVIENHYNQAKTIK
jgi:putative membrane protein